MIATRFDPVRKIIVATPTPVELDATLALVDSHGFEPISLYNTGFERRIPPLTQEELRSMDRVRWVAAGHRGVKS